MTLRVPAIGLAMAAIFSSGACWGAEPLPPLLGQLDFPNSGSAEAQPHFIEGVLYLHSFEYEQARASFRRARQVDDDFAMAYWGETMTHHQSIGGYRIRKQARLYFEALAGRQRRVLSRHPR